MDKMNPAFVVAWDNQSNDSFTFFGRLSTSSPTTEQITELKNLGCGYTSGAVFTGNDLNRSTVTQLMALDYVTYLTLSTKLQTK